MHNFDWDFQLELRHLIYIFLSSFVWLALAFWGRFQLNNYYTTLPSTAALSIIISFWIGGVGLGIGFLLVICVIFEE